MKYYFFSYTVKNRFSTTLQFKSTVTTTHPFALIKVWDNASPDVDFYLLTYMEITEEEYNLHLELNG